MTTRRRIQHQDLGANVLVLGGNQNEIRVSVGLHGPDRLARIQPANRGIGVGNIRELVFKADTEPENILRWLDVPGYRYKVSDTWFDQAAATFVKVGDR